ncbi:MAG: hypothetical protein AAF710_00820 [Planctomycetota bacterium]
MYKFLAIAGLICFVVGVVLWVQVTKATIDAALGAERAFEEAWLTLGDGWVDGEDETVFELLNETWGQAAAGEKVFGLTQRVRKLGTVDEAGLEAVRRFEAAAGAMRHRRSLQGSVQNLLAVLMGMSLAVMGGGFGWWYGRTQRHQDKLLAMQARELLPVEEQSGPANAGRAWTPEAEAALRRGFDEGRSFKRLAKDLGRSKGAVRARLQKMGLLDGALGRGGEGDTGEEGFREREIPGKRDSGGRDSGGGGVMGVTSTTQPRGL